MQQFFYDLKKANPQQTHLFLLGDIFDLWVGGGDFFVQKYKALVGALGELIKAGAKVTFIEGNHDLHIADYFQKKLGVSVFVDPQYYQIDGLTVRVEHGDLINLDEISYLRLRQFLRHPILKFLARHVYGGVWGFIGTQASRKSRKRSANLRVRNEKKLEEMVHLHAERSYQEKPFDFIVSGHMHILTDRELSIQGHKVRSINLGSWFEKEIKIFRIKQGTADWVQLPLPSDQP